VIYADKPPCMDKSNSSCGSVPETPMVVPVNSETMSTPPRMVQVHHASTSVTGPNNGNGETSHDTMQSSPALDFPFMRASSSAATSNASYRSTSRSGSRTRSTRNDNNTNNNNRTDTHAAGALGADNLNTVTSATDWNMSLNRETQRLGRRRRANSFDETLPVPRIALRPRFKRHVPNNSAALATAGRSQDSTYEAWSQRHNQVDNDHEDSQDCSCMECMIGTMPWPRNEDQIGDSSININETRTQRRGRRHFRNHTYGGSDASTDIFAAALNLEDSSGRHFLSLPMDTGSYDSNDSSRPIELVPTVPIIHNAFEMTSISATLPPAAMTFAQPTTTTATNSTNDKIDATSMSATATLNFSRPIPRHHRNRFGSGDVNVPVPFVHPFQQLRPTPPGASNQSASVASASVGTPTCTCTISTSSVSGFDQTSPPQWQDQSPESSSSIFQNLRDLSSPDSRINSREFDNLNRPNASVDANSNVNPSIERKESEFPFNEVQVLWYDQSERETVEQPAKEAEKES
jgi:hypothetical protein